MAKREKLLERAQKYIQKGYLDKAIGEYKNLATMDPSDISVRLRLGDLYVKTGDKEEAIKQYTDIAKINTRKGFYLKAIAVYKQILKLDETILDIHNKLADLYTKQRLIADAISEYSFIVNTFEKKDKTTEALDLLKKMVEIDPENVGVRLKLADLHQKLGYEKIAFGEYSWIFDRLVSQGKFDKAEKIYLGIYKNNPKEPKVLEGLSELYRKNGDNEQFAKYGSRLATIYKDSGELEKAKDLCQAILEVQPDCTNVLSIINGLKPGDTGEAIEQPQSETPPQETHEEVEAEEKKVADEVEGEEALINWPEVSEEVPTVAEDKQVLEEEQSPEAMATAEGPKVVSTEGTEQDEEEEFVEVDVPVEIEQGPEEIEEQELEQGPEEIEEQKLEQGAEEIEELETIESVEELEEGKAVAEEVPSEEPLEDVKEPSIEPVEEVEEVSQEEHADKSPEKDKAVGGKEEGAHEEDYVDLSSELGLEETLDSKVHPWSKGETGEAVDEFKDSLGEQLSKEDTETHHNLGIAYMEMELYDDAVREFKIALKDPNFEFLSYTRLGFCSMIMGNKDEAIEYYLKALKIKGRTDEERKGIMYELGLAYEAADKTLEAGGMFMAVYDMDPRYREVSEKAKRYEDLRPSIPTDDSMIEVEIL